MLEIKLFIKENLKKMSREFRNSKFSYVFDLPYGQHVVQVESESIYNQKDFAKSQIIFELEFLKRFPKEDIIFVTKDSNYNLPQFEFSVGGAKEISDIDINRINFLGTSGNSSLFPVNGFVNSFLNKGFFGSYQIATRIAHSDFNLEMDVKFDKEILSAYNSSLLPVEVNVDSYPFGIANWHEIFSAYKSELSITTTGEDNSYAMAA